jgi:hypothetical protein
MHYLQSNIQQNKKTNTNFLINSLPYILQHNLLFLMHKNYINNFTFFKNCYNSNFIIYSVINFIPFTSKKNSLIINEDQLIDNVVFIIEGRLSLEIAIDLENPEKSIKKYLSKNYNILQKNNNIIEETYVTKKSFQNSNDKLKIESLFNNFSALDIKGNIVKRDFDESNFQFLNISNIFRNEHFGEVFIIFNKPSPLYLRVKSKMAKLFLLTFIHLVRS